MTHEVQLDAVHIKALEAFTDDALHVLPDLGEGVVLAGAHRPLQGSLGQLFPGPSEQHLGPIPAKPT
ncbi:MAG TPA: hypothetical protein EYQ31_17095, partial [Candidatus Handelsmanbacteria bacterium]|nr:hypothetical protein [Candidatus Handelsmanbacteria bacterium]